MLSDRIKKLQGFMKDRDLDSLLITDPKDVYYYTGYFAEDAFLIIKNKIKPILLVSPLNNDAGKEAKAEVFYLHQEKDMLRHLEGTTGFDEGHLIASEFKFLKKSRRVKPARGIIKRPRMIKERKEIEAIKKAIRVDRKVLSNLSVYGKTEQWVANSIEMEFLMLGCTRAFPPIITSGKNTGFIHKSPSKRVITKKDMVILDLGCSYNHYCTDMTRVLYNRSDRKSRILVRNIKNIQDEIMDFIKPGLKFSDIQEFYKKVMEKRNYKIMHYFGHGVGLDVHERPGKEDILAKDMVITIEPGVYFKNRGCRIEDMFLVTSKGVKKLS